VNVMLRKYTVTNERRTPAPHKPDSLGMPSPAPYTDYLFRACADQLGIPMEVHFTSSVSTLKNAWKTQMRSGYHRVFLRGGLVSIGRSYGPFCRTPAAFS